MARGQHKIKYPWKTMEVGESFILNQSRFYAKDYVDKASRRTGRVFDVSFSDSQVVVTRMPDNPKPSVEPISFEIERFLDRLEANYPGDQQVKEYLSRVRIQNS